MKWAIDVKALSHQLAQHPITIIDRHQLELCHMMTMTMTTTPLHNLRHITSHGTNDNNDDASVSHVPEVKEGK